ncbi:hypothetical protein [Dictyobacter kobayashii]|uniref:hypothetical protein n=1 Tax=Dictyobacter kobayashii TaxID=2014872 RepID=UPI000F83D36E|nr:hypothetical protein [Dictyobacter kobayashii]
MQRKRQQAFAQPASYQASYQPVPAPQIPQPDRVVTTTKVSAILLIILLFSFIFLTVMGVLSFSISLLVALLIGAVITLAIGILLFIATYIERSKPKWPYVEVSEDGIATAIDKIRQPIPWQDICFFATYKGPSTPIKINSDKYAPYYELASPQRIIRWQYHSRLSPRIKIQPELDQAAYDRWHQQLLGYIKERTGLPLVDLDAVPANWAS